MSMFPDMNLIADSLGWAVLHSLWQGLLAAGIVFIIRSATRERASEARYFVGIVTLCALLFAFIGTFLYYYNTGAAAMSLGQGRVETITLALPSVVDATSTNPLLRLGDFTGLIGIFWTVCFAVLGTRYLAAFRLTHKLRNHGLSDLPADCQARFRALVATSGVSPRVRAYFSEHVSSPITFGFLKPIILVPTWFFTGMSAEQCEAVLLHELAHIRRHDYLTNIVQIAIKTVFFYHPAVGFICKGLDTDREHACDDFAVMLTKNPQTLATALGAIRLRAAGDGGVFALSAGGRDAPLMYRLKRLMGTGGTKAGNGSLQRGTSRGLAATAMIGTALALIMTLGTTASQAHPHKEGQIETPDWDKLAGAATTDLDAWGENVDSKITVKGETYKATRFDYATDGKDYDIINGKKYPSKYAYSVFTRDGENYVVKKKKGKRYMEIGDNWFLVDDNNALGASSVPTPSVPPPAPTTPVFPTNGPNYWVSDQVFAATEARAERASERREAALERAEERREREMERAEERRERKQAQAEQGREMARELAELARELEQDQAELMRDFAQNQAELERELSQDNRELAREMAELEKELAQDQAELAQDFTQGQAEIAREMAKVMAKTQANWQSSQYAGSNYNVNNDGAQRARDNAQRIRDKQQKLRDKQQKARNKAQQKRQEKQYARNAARAEKNRIKADKQRVGFEKMRDRLIPLLKTDGYMKSDKSKVTIKMTPTDMFINGKKLTDAKEGQYCDIISNYIDRKGDVKKIVIKPGYLHVSQKNKGGQNSSYTYNETYNN